MKRVLVVALVMLAGCGRAFPSGKNYVPPEGQPLPAAPPGVPIGSPLYQIDAGAGANVPLGTYGITTNGITWYLEWQTDASAHRFTGDIYCPVGCDLAFIAFGSHPAGNTYSSVDPNHFHFDSLTERNSHQHLEFDSPLQPVSFDLKIDGQTAANPYTAFSSESQLVTTDVMPFNLLSTNATAPN